MNVPKLRFKEFKDDYIKLRYKDVLKIKSGKDQKQVEDKNGKYPILGTGGQIGKTNSFLYDKPSVLIGRKGTINKPQYMESPFWTVDTLFYSHIYEPNIPKYLFYLFQNVNCIQKGSDNNIEESLNILGLGSCKGISQEILNLIVKDRINQVITDSKLYDSMDYKLLKEQINKILY